MTYQTILTSKGTTTIPKEIRDELGIKPGEPVIFTRNKAGQYTIDRLPSIEEIRAMNKRVMQRAGTWGRPQHEDDGWATYVQDKYGKSS